MADPEGAEAPQSTELEDFIYLVSHDLRASMRALLELPAWIKEDLEEAGISLPSSVSEHMALLDRHTSRLDRMLYDLLAYSRAGRLQDIVDIGVETTIDQILEEAPLPDGWVLHRDLNHRQVRFGEKDILTLLGALISNAVKHHGGGTGQIWIGTEQVGDDFVLTVADDGPGIAKEHRSTVIEIMRTLRPRDQVEGSGMGLALVAKLAKLYGGSLEIGDRNGGTGALIRFRVPAQGGLLERCE